MSASSLSVSSPAAATVLEGTIPPALFLLVPLFTFALALLALSHRPQQQEKTTTSGGSRPQARISYAFIAVLAVLSTLAGALPLSHAGSPRAEAVVQALLSSFLAIPVLHLASSSDYYSSPTSRALLGLLHSSILVITLSGAALFALLLPFLHSSSTTPPYLPAALFLFYSLLAFPRISWSLYRFLYPATSARASHLRKPITIHISTQRTSVPLSLSSSIGSFSCAQDLAKPDSSVIEDRDSRIELAITLPKRNDNRRSRLNEEDNSRYAEQKSHPHQQTQKHKHDRSLSSTSSTSTITAVDHTTRATSDFPLISLTTPPRAAYTSAYIPSFEPIGLLSAHPRVEEHLYRFPDESNPGQSALTTDENNQIEGIDNKTLRTQLIHNRSRSLLVFLLAAQVTLVVGYSCAVGANISSDTENTVLPLRIVQAACTVLAVTGTMSAYLLHAYNTHISPSRSRGSRRNRASLIDSEQPHTHTQMLLSSPFSSSSSATAFTPSPQQLHYQGIQMAEDESNNARPVLIQLEPPPPPRTRRKRVDAGLGSALERNHNNYLRSASGSSNSEEHTAMRQGTVNRSHDRRHYSSDVSYTYPYTHTRTPSGHYREPIVLAYEPPKVRTPEDASLLEMTEPEGRGLELDFDFGEGDLEYMDGDLELDLEVEMERALTLSRSSSRATSKSGLSSRRGHIRAASDRRRTSASIHAAAARRMSASFQVTTATTKGKPGAVRNSTMVIDLPHANHNGTNATRKKKTKEDDPATYIRKRGSLPAVPQTRKLFKWEFGRDQQPSTSRSKSTTRSRETEPGRNHATFGSVDAVTEDSFMDVMKGEGAVTQATRARKLKKRSKSALRPSDAESTIASQSPAYPMPTRSHVPEPAVESPPSSASYNTFGVRCHHGRSPSRPGTPESKSGGSHGSKSSLGSREGLPPDAHLHGQNQPHRPVLNLKRSFKMGVGRTLGPSLTLASVDNGDDMQERRERRPDKDEDFGRQLVNAEDLDEVDSETWSIAAAKLVSATIARASPAATIVTVPTPAGIITPPPSSSRSRYPASPVNIKYPVLISTQRPVLPAIVTAGATNTDSPDYIPFPKSAPATTKYSPMARTPSSTKAPHTSGSTWRPHPFADRVESQQTTRRVSVPASYGNESSTDDDMVSLEREMEEIRGLRSGGGQNKMDSPTTQFKELAALMSIPMPTAPALPSPIPSPRKLKGGIFTGQKRPSMSTSPNSKSDWTPVSSSSTAATGSSQDDYPYRFPMFFPGSNSNSPPKVQSSVANPRGPGSGLRLSAKTMDTVRSAFAGVGARMSMRTSMHSTAAGSTKGAASSSGNFGEAIVKDQYADFMDLCDPFASPPLPASTIPITPVVKKKPSKHGSVTREVGDSSWVDSSIAEEIDESATRKMSAWGKLPMPVRSYSPNPTTNSKRHSSNGRIAVVRAVGKPSRRHKKDRRSRKSTLPGPSPKPQSPIEDADFGLEEALLSQRLLSRLDAYGWENRI